MKETENNGGFIARLSGIDRRVLFLIILICVVIPLLAGARTKMSITPPVRGLYDAIEGLEPGSYVWLAADYDPGSMPELYPMNISLVEHLFSKDIKVICAALWPPGPPLAQRVFDEMAAKYGKTYGVDYVNLGFKEGREAVMVSVAEDMRTAFPEDFAGTAWDSIPMLEGIRNLTDLEMIVCVSAGYPGIKEWIQQVSTRYDITTGGGVTAVTGPEMYPYIQSGQLVGLLAGMKGAAEYEQLVGKPGLGLSGMVAQSYVHLMVVVFIIFANIIYFVEKRRAG
ncbi:MAG: hypothetical protein ABIJ00_02335 [Candidatus Eisenbacteria bacterium]